MEIKITQAQQAQRAVNAKKRTYYINAGHRGTGTGAHGFFDEAKEAISLRDTIAKDLRNHGCLVVTDSDKADLNTVVRSINNTCSENDICIDIHFNAAGSQQANGTEVLIRNNFSTAEKLLAHSLQNAIVKTLGTNDRGVKTESKSQHKTLAMLSGIKCTAVLLEVCFCTNASDASTYQQHFFDLASAISGILIKQL